MGAELGVAVSRLTKVSESGFQQISRFELYLDMGYWNPS